MSRPLFPRPYFVFFEFFLSRSTQAVWGVCARGTAPPSEAMEGAALRGSDVRFRYPFRRPSSDSDTDTDSDSGTVLGTRLRSRHRVSHFSFTEKPRSSSFQATSNLSSLAHRVPLSSISPSALGERVSQTGVTFSLSSRLWNFIDDCGLDRWAVIIQGFYFTRLDSCHS